MAQDGAGPQGPQDEHARRAEMPTAAVEPEQVRRALRNDGPDAQGPPAQPRAPYGPPPQGPAGQAGYGPPPPGYRQGPPPGPPAGGYPPGGFAGPAYAPLAMAAPASMPAKLIGWAILAFCVLAVVGCFGTWGSVSVGMFGDVSVNGFGHVSSGMGSQTADGSHDGTIVTVLAVIVAILAVVRGIGKAALAAAIVGIIGGLCIAGIAIYDVATADSGISIGWGLWLVLISGILMLLTSAAGAVLRR